eukprot:TRINITY_DN18006_c0_g3_i1.p1 TRINITY_DN18006_c0_g3~~TRINITY_DN18006_c0_g3_i1.p1  ORF type:complete len:1398 (+),score=318.37 TRINITY_DN18006_c0_g3_i1:32-4225(+)
MLSTLRQVENAANSRSDLWNLFGGLGPHLHKALIFYLAHNLNNEEEATFILKAIVNNDSLILSSRIECQDFVIQVSGYLIKLFLSRHKAIQDLVLDVWSSLVRMQADKLKKHVFPKNLSGDSAPPPEIVKACESAHNVIASNNFTAFREWFESNFQHVAGIFASTVFKYTASLELDMSALSKRTAEIQQRQKDRQELERREETVNAKMSSKRQLSSNQLQSREQLRMVQRRQREHYQEQELARYWKRLLRNITLEFCIRYYRQKIPDRWKLDILRDLHGQRNKLTRCDEFYDVYSIDVSKLRPLITKKKNIAVEVTRMQARGLSTTIRNIQDFAEFKQAVRNHEDDRNEDMSVSERDDDDLSPSGRPKLKNRSKALVESPSEEKAGESFIRSGETFGSRSADNPPQEDNSEVDELPPRAISPQMIPRQDTSVVNEISDPSLEPEEIEEEEKEEKDAAVVAETLPPDTTEIIKEDEMILRLIEPGDQIQTKNAFYNIQRVSGLDPIRAMIILCEHNFYVIDNFRITEEGTIEEVKDYRKPSRFFTEVRYDGHDLDSGEVNPRGMPLIQVNRYAKEDEGCTDSLDEEDIHATRQVPYKSVRQVYKRRYALQNIAVEFFNVDGTNFLLVFEDKVQRDLCFWKMKSMELSDSLGAAAGGAGLYNDQSISNIEYLEKSRQKSMTKTITSKWQAGELSNFEYLMYLNTIAGRSYNDITQYPVFPWILSDYKSHTLDLSIPEIYRDLSKPMGAIGPDRSEQCKMKYEAVAQDSEVSGLIPWHYVSHYSSYGIVLGYLIRMEPFSRMHCEFQSGHFDHADRLFKNLAQTWDSASCSGHQDFKELIPEFFCLSNFLRNSNFFDLGSTQKGVLVHDVVLPPWSKNDPELFVRINRMALESDYVSQHLNDWIDLIFGYKQTGKHAIEAQNVFHPDSYEDHVNIESITDPEEKKHKTKVLLEFGQTPHQLFKKPHPRRKLPKRPWNLYDHSRGLEYRQIKQVDKPVSQIYVREGQLLVMGGSTAIVPPKYRKYVRWNYADKGIRFVQLVSTPKHPVNKLRAVHEDLHDGQITCIALTEDGKFLITGGEDATIGVWIMEGKKAKHRNLGLERKLCSHTKAITCLAASASHGLLVSGGEDRRVIFWDLNKLFLLIRLPRHPDIVNNVHINSFTGDVISCAGNYLTVWTINGVMLVREKLRETMSERIVSIALSQEPTWISSNKMIITGHRDGTVCCWKLQLEKSCDSHHDPEQTKPTAFAQVDEDVDDQEEDAEYFDANPSMHLTLAHMSMASEDPVTAIYTDPAVWKRFWTGDLAGNVFQWEVNPSLADAKLDDSTCQSCGAVVFNDLDRRHHCRKCGKPVCRDCLKTTIVQEMQYKVCTDCRGKLGTMRDSSMRRMPIDKENSVSGRKQ